MELSKDELTTIYGGAAKLGLGVTIMGIVTFLIGVIDGYLRPSKCNK